MNEIELALGLSKASELAALKRIPKLAPSGNQVVLAGNPGGLARFLLLWLPLTGVLCYAFLAPILAWSAWGYDNLMLTLGLWALLWLLLLAFTLANGASRQIYLVDVDQHTLTHLNSGESVSMALKLTQHEGFSLYELAQPLRAGLQLNASGRTLSELQPGDIPEIPEWQPPGLKAHLKDKFRDVGWLTFALTLEMPLAIVHFVFERLDLFLLCQPLLLAAWFLGQTVDGLMEQRDYRALQRARA
ncbi:hypothetical protein [Marinobacter daepoensis]|uniref:hypothetical protein n=1 Tax=Marinobacter daepoensis TaxID=262077 RepID=UPI000417DCA6|nr:hypothetical protein [Marinobacter daepoensis]